MRVSSKLGIAGALFLPALAVAQIQGLRLDFAPGEAITAAAINSNFALLATELDGLKRAGGSVATTEEVEELRARIAVLEDSTVHLISRDLVLSVPGEFSTPQAALESIAGTRIATGKTLTVSIAAGTYTALPVLAVDHPDGKRIRIVGAGSQSTVLQFLGSGVKADYGSAIGLLDRLTLVGSYAGDSSGPDTWGVASSRTSSIDCGSDLVVRAFEFGFLAGSSSYLNARGTTAENSFRGYAAIWGGWLLAEDTTSRANYYAYSAWDQGYIRASGTITVTGPTNWALHASLGSIIRVREASFSADVENLYNMEPGVQGDDGALIIAP